MMSLILKRISSYSLEKCPGLLFSVIVLVVYALAGFLVYSDVLSHGIFMFDDHDYILTNDSMNDSLWANFSDPRYIGYLSFKLNELIGGKREAFGYHLFNVSIHVLNGILVYFLFRQMLAWLSPRDEKDGEYNRAVSTLAGFIFILHPLATQSVSYITQRFTSLSTFFYLFAICIYIFSRIMFENRRDVRAWLSYASAFIATVLAMKTKEISFTIPFMILFLELTIFRVSAFGKRRFIFLIPFIVTLAVIPLSILGPELGFLAQGEGVAELTRKEKLFDVKTRSSIDYLLTQFRVIVIYLRLLVLPINQAVVYDLRASKSLFEPKVIGSLFLILGVLSAGLYAWIKGILSDGEKARGYQIVGIGIVWFFLTLSIESSFVPIKDLIFEHRTYLPSAGAYAVLSVFLVALIKRFILPQKPFFLKFIVLLLAIAISLGTMTYMRNKIWVDEIAFWNDAVRSAPDKPIAYHNRAYTYTKHGLYEQALRDFDKSISYFTGDIFFGNAFERGDLSPYNMSKAYENRASLLTLMGHEDLAEEDRKRAKSVFFISAIPESMPVSELVSANEGSKRPVRELYAMGKSMLYQGHPAKAVDIFTELLRQDGNNAFALVNRGNALCALKDYARAILDFNRAIELKADFSVAYYNRGIAYAWLGDKSLASHDFNKACALGLKSSCGMSNDLENNRGIFTPAK